MTGTDTNNTQFTTFGNEACEAVDVFANYQPNTLAKPQVNIQDIKAYFERPRLISRGSIPFGSTSQLLPGFGFGANMATMQSIWPQWKDRLAGAFGIRFKLNFKLQVAATAFHQGVICMNWQYNKIGVSDANYARGLAPWTATNLPHVRLDMSETTMVELSIPFLYTGEFMEVLPNTSGSDYLSDYGQLVLIPILPSVSVAGLSPATYDLYCYLTDIELFGVDVVNPASIVLQSDTLSQEVKKSRVVSGTLSNMAKISRFVARGIPSLSAMAGPASWALDTAAGVAKYFGYSKPMMQDPPAKHFRSDWASDHHADVPMTGEVIGMFQGNTTTVSSALGATDVDEMSLAFVTRQWSQVLSGAVVTGNTHGTPVYVAPVSPSVMYYRRPSAIPFSNRAFPSDSSTGYSAFQPSSLMYVASFFRLWRGSIKFRVTFAKTKLHGGRYMISFVPYHSINQQLGNFGGVALGPEIVSSLQQPYGNSMIMDLKDGNVFEFTAPYELPTPYCNFTSASGGISIVCIDPLQATGTVTPTVPFLVEVCGGDDFELADYAGPYFTPHPSGAIQIQSSDLVMPTTIEPSAHTIGEKVTSLKQVIMQPSFEQFSLAGNNTSNFRIAPWFTNINYLTTNASLTNPNTANQRFVGSPAAAIAKCYAFAKGGTDLHVYPEFQNVFLYRAYQVAAEFTTANVNAASLSRRPFPSSTPKAMQTSVPLHVRFPSYQTVVRIPTAAYDSFYNTGVTSLAVGSAPLFLSHQNNVDVNNKTTTSRLVYLLRAASDDASLAHYMGPPPVYVPNAANVALMDLNAAGF